MRLFAFTMQTKLPVAACLNRIETHPTRGVRGSVWYRIAFQVELTELSHESNSFRLSLLNQNLLGPQPVPLASAQVTLACAGDVTILHGDIINGRWKYPVLLPLSVFLPLLAGVGLAMFSRGQYLGCLGSIGFAAMWLSAYIFQTLDYQKILMDAIRERLCSG